MVLTTLSHLGGLGGSIASASSVRVLAAGGVTPRNISLLRYPGDGTVTRAPSGLITMSILKSVPFPRERHPPFHVVFDPKALFVARAC